MQRIAKVCCWGGKQHSSEYKSGRKATRREQNPYKVAIQLDGREITVQIDTSVAVSIISQATLKIHFSRAVLAKPSVNLRTYMTKPIPVLGEISMMVEYNGYRGNHTLHVVGRYGPSLLGRDWLKNIKINCANIKVIMSAENKQEVESLLTMYPQVFQSDLGTMTERTAHLTLKPDPQLPPPSRTLWN